MIASEEPVAPARHGLLLVCVHSSRRGRIVGLTGLTHGLRVDCRQQQRWWVVSGQNTEQAHKWTIDK